MKFGYSRGGTPSNPSLNRTPAGFAVCWSQVSSNVTSQESLDIPTEGWLEVRASGSAQMVQRLRPIDAEVSAEPRPFDCERIVLLRLRVITMEE